MLPVMPADCSSRIIARPVVDFPDPDSPTSATISPRPISKLTLRTARIGPFADGNDTERSLTLRRRSRLIGLFLSVSEQVEADDRQGDRQAGREAHQRIDRQVLDAVTHHAAPIR